MYKAADAVLKDGHEMERAKMIATIRAESCNIIFKFLTALKSGMRSAVSGYLRCRTN